MTPDTDNLQFPVLNCTTSVPLKRSSIGPATYFFFLSFLSLPLLGRLRPFLFQSTPGLIRRNRASKQTMASINDLATAASALVSPAVTAPHPQSSLSSLPDSARTTTQDGVDDNGDGGELPAAVARGALVVLEGLDRSGKTTQVKLLEQRFVELGRKVKVMRFPGTWFVVQTHLRRTQRPQQSLI